MGYYINDIVSFSENGFDKIDFNFIDSPVKMEIEKINSKHLQGKGLRFVPRTVQMMHNVVAEILDKNKLELQKDMVGIYNTNDICALEAGIDFDREVRNYGVKLANPMKIPFTLNGATAGWIAIRNKMNNVNLSVNSGRCGILSAFNLAGLDFMDGETNHTIILGAHLMGEMYEKYNQQTTFNKEVAVGILASKLKTATSMMEVLECRTMSYNKELLEAMLKEPAGYHFVEADFYINLQDRKQIHFIQSTSAQLSCLPFFINNIHSFINKDTKETCKYIVVDKKGFMGYLKFKLTAA